MCKVQQFAIFVLSLKRRMSRGFPKNAGQYLPIPASALHAPWSRPSRFPSTQSQNTLEPVGQTWDDEDEDVDENEGVNEDVEDKDGDEDDDGDETSSRLRQRELDCGELQSWSKCPKGTRSLACTSSSY